MAKKTKPAGKSAAAGGAKASKGVATPASSPGEDRKSAPPVLKPEPKP
jgi:hypothetical protein